MVLDEKYFRKKLLAPIIRKTLPSFFPNAGADDKTILVRDRGGQIVFAYGKGDGKGEMVTARFPFVFTDWTMDLTSARNMPEERANASFAFNLSLSILLALALLGGLAFAFRSADKAMKLSRDEIGFRVERLARAAHAARVDPGVRRAAAAGPGAHPREGPASTASTSRPRAAA